MKEKFFGTILKGEIRKLRLAYHDFSTIPVDLELQYDDVFDSTPKHLKTISEPVDVSGPGTFDRDMIRTLRFEPTDKQGWWFKRTDLPDSEPVKVTYKNAFYSYDSAVNCIVLKDKNNATYMKLIEHIIAMKLGLDIDSLIVSTGSDDPPLFTDGSAAIIDALDKVEVVRLKDAFKYYTVKNTVSAVWPNGAFIIVVSPTEGSYALNIDCAINFPNVIGKQRIRFPLNIDDFKFGAQARTNSNFKHAFIYMMFGRFFKKTRTLGYNAENLLIAGKKRYFNTPKMMHNGKSLEAVWHRATLDLLAAFSLIEEGRLIGKIISYKAGHREDLEFVKALYEKDLLTEVKIV